jgi:hypothetical protein
MRQNPLTSFPDDMSSTAVTTIRHVSVILSFWNAKSSNILVNNLVIA